MLLDHAKANGPSGSLMARVLGLESGNTPIDDEVALEGPDDARLDELVDSDVLARWRDEIDLVRTAARRGITRRWCGHWRSWRTSRLGRRLRSGLRGARGRYAAGAPTACPALRSGCLRCSDSGPAAELAPLPSVVSLKHLQRVSFGSARVRARP
ncbi:MAG: hypothetical protein HC938_17475 [Nitrospira sp.]|nr:hypothetical protein [Nitrospira sp.]